MSAGPYYAHTPPDNDPAKWQTMQEHTDNVGKLAMHFAKPFGGEELAKWAAWLHDVGKYSDEFQQYLRECHAAKISGGPFPRPGSAEHKCAGTKLALDLLPTRMHNVVAPCVLGHHGGLNAISDLKNTINTAGEKHNLALATNCAREDFPSLQTKPVEHVPGWQSIENRDKPNKILHLEMLTRFVFSCLVDADSLDTERHFSPDKAALRSSFTLQEMGKDWLETLKANQKEVQLKAADMPVNRVRSEVYQSCLQAAELSPGVFSLTVPTGGGKTRSSLAFALEHAVSHGHERIIYAIPYTSIIDQTVGVFRSILGDENILEHHSAIDVRTSGDRAIQIDAQVEAAQEQQRRLAAENWDAPLIVTTTVQLFESLFANRTSRCRKLHHIANSIIILDEVQTLPAFLLSPLLSGLRALVEHYGVTLVLCTATQPALTGKTRYLEGLPAPTQIVAASEAKRHFDILRRVTYQIAPEPWDWTRVAGEMKSQQSSCLAIVNTKRDALSLLRALDSPKAFHLSTLLCGSHRKRVLADIHKGLLSEREGGPPLLLIATQVIEAGVDVDFPRVLRAKAPLDRIIQAAGRCNREGLRSRQNSKVIVFEPTEGGIPPGEYKTASDLAWSLVSQTADFDFDSPEVATDYFTRLYNLLGTQVDRERVQEARIAFDFPSVADKVRLIKDDTIPVLVPYDKPSYEKLVHTIRLRQEKNLGLSRELWRQLQPFTVAIYKTEVEKLQSILEELVPDQLFAWHGEYDDVIGIGKSVGRDPSD